MVAGIYSGTAAEFNAFIGRDRELRELRALAAGARALTLCGAGGIGKTRLAVRLLADLAGGYPDGAWFVELADLRQPELVASRIASVIGVTEEPGRPLLATLADALRSRRMLLCVDNCEHLIEACAHACHRLLASSAGLRVIATSREPLRVAAETVWQVPPLSLPPASAAAGGIATGGADGPAGAGGGPAGGGGGHPGSHRGQAGPRRGHPRAGAGSSGPDPGGRHSGADDEPGASPGRADALRLFADRAAAAKPGFVLGPANIRAVTEICRSLDGLPLAIELAAAWVRALTVEQIAARLSDRFRLLNSADRTVPARHRTLRDAIDWSHDLLSPREKILLRRLSVFADWPLDMAEQVCAHATSGDDIAASEVLDLITGLVDKSLVITEPVVSGKVRYRMLDTIREYAAARLAEAGETELMQRRFRAYTVAETENLSMMGMAQVSASWSARVDALMRFDAENANVGQVLGQALADGDVESGLRICVAMRAGWIPKGSFAEGAGWTDAFLSGDRSGLSDDVLGSALVGRAQLAMATDPDAARGYALEGLALCRSDAARFWAASALNLLAEVALHARDLDEAAARADQAMAAARPAGDRWNEGYAAGTLAATAAFRGDLALAAELAEKALEISRVIDQQWGSARALLGLGDLARLTGDLTAANERYADALAIVREINAKPEIARCLAGLGRIAISQGDLAAAAKYFGDSLELSRSTGSRIGVIRGLDAFAALATNLGMPEAAVQLAAAAAALRAEAGLPEASTAKISKIIEAAAPLGDQAVGDLWEAGLLLGDDAAVSLALAISEQSGPDRHREAPRAGTGAGAAASAMSQRGEPARFAAPSAGGLTARELQIAGLIAGGASNRAIADALVITPATAARHVANIMGKLGFNSRSQIAAWALRRASEDRTGR